ncbi:MAG: phage tail protein [Ktedonobacterales bacterium]
MALSVKHNFVSAKSDGLDTTKIQPSNWNDGHVLLAAVDKVIGTDSGSTTVKELACTAAGRAVLAAADAPAQRAALGVMGVPVGASFSWHTNTLPVMDAGIEVAWMNGQAISRTTYAALFALLGTVYGAGNGTTTFNVPNACECVLLGRSLMGGAASRGFITHLASTDVIGTVVGEGTHVLDANQIPSHTHGNFLSDPSHIHGNFLSDPSHVHTGVSVANSSATGTGSGTSFFNFNAPSTTANAFTGESFFNVAANTGLSLNNVAVGGGLGHNNVQVGLITNFVMRIK